MEPMHKQQAGSSGPTRCASGGFTAASVLDPQLTIDTRAAEVDQMAHGDLANKVTWISRVAG